RAARAAAAAAEEAAEHVLEVVVREHARPAADPVVDGAAAARAAEAEEAAAVELLALVRVADEVVRGLHFLEALLGLLVLGIAIRVVPPGELAVRLLDLVLRRVLRHAEDLVRVASVDRH